MKNLIITPDMIDASGRRPSDAPKTIQAALAEIKANIGQPHLMTNEAAILIMVDVLGAFSDALGALGK